MVCSNCGAQNDAGRKFCAECGTRLATACSACGSANPASAKFCGECGTTLGGAAAAGPPAAAAAVAASRAPEIQPAAELKLVSILFADLVGFTTASEKRDPEAVRETLTHYFETATTVVERYGGTIEKFIGDAVMAVWGTPVAHEDDAERAVRAAMDLVRAVEALSADAGLAALQARAAVLTGEAAVTIGARNQGLVAGDLVNTASRLQSLAEPGTVLVGEATMRAAEGGIAFEPAGEHLVKGREAPIVAYRALRVVGKVRGVGRSESLEAPFVGRDAELRLVRDLYHATARERRARLVSVVGQAGIGKSRLLWEFSKYTDGLAETLRWHQGRSPAYGEGVTFWALSEMIRQRAGILEGEDAEATRAKLSAAAQEFVPDPAERRWIEPALRQLLGVHEGRSPDRDELFAAWRTFFERIAEKDPTVLVFEDLHWADSGLLDFIEHLLEWSRNFPIYIVTLARPELLERRPTWGAGQRSFTSISLEPLPDDAMRELLAGLVPGLPEQVMRTILARAEGVPLYAVETVRMLLQDGRLEAAEGTYRPTGTLTDIAVPDSLQALISARLDALDPSDRSLLQDAAILGQTFSLDALAAVSGEAIVGLDARLRALVRREVLVLDTDPRSPERGQFGFTQGLIREVAYGTLAKRDRRTRHIAAARYFEALGDEELAGVLARHYLDAYRASPAGPEADAVAAQARLALRAAADRAVQLGSSDQAVVYLNQALDVAADDRERAELHERIAMAASAAGHDAVAVDEAREAIDRYRRLGARIDALRVTAALGWGMSTGGASTEGAEMLRAAAEEFADLTETPEGVILTIRLAGAIRDERPAEAMALLEKANVVAEHHDLLPVVLDGLMARTGALILLHRQREASALISGVQALAEENDLAHHALRAQGLRVFLAAATDPRTGVAVGRTAIELARRLGRRDNWLNVLGNVERCAIRTGDWEWLDDALTDGFALGPEGLAEFELVGARIVLGALRGAEIAIDVERINALEASLDDPQATAWHRLTFAWVAFAAGRVDEAARLGEEAAAATEFYAPEAWPLVARAAARQGDAARLGRALAALDGSGIHGPAIAADRVTITANVAVLGGDQGEAIRLYRDAMGRWRDLGLAWDLALCQIDYLTVLGDAPDAEEVLGEVRATLARLRATPVARALEEAWAGRSPAGSPEATALVRNRAVKVETPRASA
jgi:class 3 adenylate cyclase/tetratricopeptide (TPR) repeat protein